MFGRNAISGFNLDERVAELSRLGVVHVTNFEAIRLRTAEMRLRQVVALKGTEAEIEEAAGEYLLALPEPSPDDTVIDSPCGYCGSCAGSDDYGYCINCGGY